MVHEKKISAFESLFLLVQNLLCLLEMFTVGFSTCNGVVRRDPSPPAAVEGDGSDLVISVRVFDLRLLQLGQVLGANVSGLVEFSGFEMPLVLRQQRLQLLRQFRRQLRVELLQLRVVVAASLALAFELVSFE